MNLSTPISEIPERELLDALRAARDEIAPGGAGVVIDSGDDAAVLRPAPGRDLVVTTDAFVDGVHFLPEWFDGETLGARLAAANLSDLAAMAAAPRWALLSMGLDGRRTLGGLLELQRGVARALHAAGAALVGGNITRVSGPEWFSLTLAGDVAAGAAWRRNAGRAGDLVAVTGYPGRAGAGCALAMSGPENARRPEFEPLIQAWREPRPRVSLATALAAAGGVMSAVDISDGFAADIAHLPGQASGVRIDEERWPHDAHLEAAARSLGRSIDAMRFAASDDYELLLAVDPERAGELAAIAAAHNVPWTIVGEVIASPGARRWVRRGGHEAKLPTGGWDPFGAQS